MGFNTILFQMFALGQLVAAFTHQSIYQTCSIPTLDQRSSHLRKNAVGGTPMTCLFVNDASDGTSTQQYERRRAKLGKIPIISRTIPISIEVPEHAHSKSLEVTIWEMEKPSEMIQAWWTVEEAERTALKDPFGVVMWPGSIVASQELMKRHYCSSESKVENTTILVLGAGTGVETQAAALLGAQKVIATDINQMSLNLLDYGTSQINDISGIVESRYFDIYSEEKLPQFDILVGADILYNSDLARQVGLRLYEAISRALNDDTPFPKIVIADSQQFHGTNFLVEVEELRELHKMLYENGMDTLRWKDTKLTNITTSGVVIDEDQEYDVNVRLLSWGW